MAIEEPPNDHDPWGDPRHQSDLDIWLIRFKSLLVKRLRRSPKGGLRRPHRWRHSLPWAILLIVGVWLASGLGTLAPGEVALFYVLGQPVGRATSGTFWSWPSPLGQVRMVDVSAPHNRLVAFHALTLRDRPVAVTVHYVYQILHPGAYQYFAPHPAVWLRGEILSRFGGWIRHAAYPIPSAQKPTRPVDQPPIGLIRHAINEELNETHTGLHLLNLTATVQPPAQVRKTERIWHALHADQKAAIRKAQRAFRQSYVAQKLSEQHKRLAIELRTRRWIEQARLTVARFLSILAAYRLHPVLVRQWLVGSFLRKLKGIPRIMGTHAPGLLLGPRSGVPKKRSRVKPDRGSAHPGHAEDLRR